MPKRNKYSNLKLAWYDEKREALYDGITTAPIYVRLKPTNRCCHGCAYCVYNYDVSKMHENMSRQDELPALRLLTLIDELAKIGVKAITLSGGGEPLMHPEICRAMTEIKQSRMALSIITNGQLLNGERAVCLEDAWWVRVSLDSVNEEQFEQHRKRHGSYFRKILENIKAFSESKSKHCDLTGNFIITHDNYKSIVDAVELYGALGIENIRFSPMWTPNFKEYHSEIIADVMVALESARMKYAGTPIEISDSYSLEHHAGTRICNRCYIMEIVPVIGADGKIYSCHNKAYTDDGMVGSVLERSFREVWYSENTRRFFDTFDPHICTHQCSNDRKNELIDDMINARGDPFV